MWRLACKPYICFFCSHYSFSDEFISDTLQRYAEYVQGSDVYDDLSFRGGLENLDLDTILQQHGGAAGQDYMSERIISSVYQEVESEPLVL